MGAEWEVNFFLDRYWCLSSVDREPLLHTIRLRFQYVLMLLFNLLKEVFLELLWIFDLHFASIFVDHLLLFSLQIADATLSVKLRCIDAQDDNEVDPYHDD